MAESSLEVTEVLARLAERKVEIGRFFSRRPLAGGQRLDARDQIRVSRVNAARMHQVQECGRESGIAAKRSVEGGLRLGKLASLHVQGAETVVRLRVPWLDGQCAPQGFERLIAPPGVLPGKRQRNPGPRIVR